jgi:phospholipid-binding lipoprotein MlaA
VATSDLNWPKQDEDLGQTLGVYGLGNAFFINWPFLGPSSLRDTLGLVGDAFLDPIFYLDTEWGLALAAYDIINETSLIIGDYEDLKKAALDPYVALRDAYYQNRQTRIQK